MRVVIDDKSGFCAGVVRAISEAERALEQGGEVFSLFQDFDHFLFVHLRTSAGVDEGRAFSH